MKLVLDGRSVTDCEDLHHQMENVLNFPEWYGGNLDALYDCLTELMEEVDIRILHMDALKSTLGNYADKLLQVLEDAAQVNLNIQIVTE